MSTRQRHPVFRLLLMLLAVASLAVAALPAFGDEPALPPGGTFLDDDRNPFESSIEALVAAGVTTGCRAHEFCPNRPATRAEVAAFLVRALGEQGSMGVYQGLFSDVPADAWYRPYIERLAELGIVTGHSDGTYRPGAPVSRAEMAALLVRAIPDAPVYDPTMGSFADVPVDAWYAPYVERLYGLGITVGCKQDPLRYCPGDSVRRDHMAVFLTRAFGLTPRPVPARYAPLNGLPVGNPYDVWRRVVAHKIDNARGGRPQSGVQEADAVVETLVEGGLTRWIALFHQSDTSYAGPIRSGRPTDTGLLLPLGATMVASGGQPWILDLIGSAGVPILRERDVVPPALRRISTRAAPHNLYADTTALRAEADAHGYPDVPPLDLFRWAPLVRTDAPTASTLSLSWSDPITITWTWDGAHYANRLNGVPQTWVYQSGQIGQITVDTVVVIIAPVYEVFPPAGVSGSPVPSLDTVGSGRVLVFTNGRVLDGRWSRSTEREPFDLRYPDGSPLTVPPGVPWVNVFPAGRPVDWR
ncbi:MAG: DUF3048 domain-containing protein [Acidimicrobiia bacterium]|nr:DUF3048 domain-containing protein [Acidimicrobiia bacterium]